jgi:uncharacterized phage infection (PIP) family protein YhgE
MSDIGNQSWDEAVDSLRRAAGEVRSALGRTASPSGDEDAAAARLKDDVSRLEQSASDLLTKLSAGLGERRTEIESSFDRERVERSAEQMKGSLEELAALAGSLTSHMASAASGTLKQTEPELKTAVRALEDVAGSAASWIRTVIDPAREKQGTPSPEGQPPLDDL